MWKLWFSKKNVFGQFVVNSFVVVAASYWSRRKARFLCCPILRPLCVGFSSIVSRLVSIECGQVSEGVSHSDQVLAYSLGLSRLGWLPALVLPPKLLHKAKTFL